MKGKEDTLRLGCKAGELETFEEFSYDEGRTWVVVKKIDYVSEDSTDLDIWVQPSDDTRLAASYHITLPDNKHVHLERNWGSNIP